MLKTELSIQTNYHFASSNFAFRTNFKPTMHFKSNSQTRFASFTLFPYFSVYGKWKTVNGIQHALVRFSCFVNFGNSAHLSQFRTAFLFSAAMLCKTVDCRVNDVVLWNHQFNHHSKSIWIWYGSSYCKNNLQSEFFNWKKVNSEKKQHSRRNFCSYHYSTRTYGGILQMCGIDKGWFIYAHPAAFQQIACLQCMQEAELQIFQECDMVIYGNVLFRIKISALMYNGGESFLFMRTRKSDVI